MHVLFAALLVIANALFAADVDGPVGTSRLVSWPDHQQWTSARPLWRAPEGFLILTKEGRLMVLTTAENRNPGMSYHQRAELHKSRVADSGKFRIEEAIGKARRDALPAHQGTRDATAICRQSARDSPWEKTAKGSTTLGTLPGPPYRLAPLDNHMMSVFARRCGICFLLRPWISNRSTRYRTEFIAI